MDIPLEGEILVFVKSIFEGFTRNKGYTHGITVVLVGADIQTLYS